MFFGLTKLSLFHFACENSSLCTYVQESFIYIMSSALGAIDLDSRRTVHAYVPHPHLYQINEKELQASAFAVRSLARPGFCPLEGR